MKRSQAIHRPDAACNRRKSGDRKQWRAAVSVLVCSALGGCTSQQNIGKVMTIGGGVLVGVGALDYVGAFGSDCTQRSTENELMGSCGNVGKGNKGDGVSFIGIGATVALVGALFWALGDAPRGPAPAKTSPNAAPEPEGPMVPLKADASPQR